MIDMIKKIMRSNQNAVEHSTIINSSIIQINGDNIDPGILAKELGKFPKKLLNDLLSSKLLDLRDLLLRGRFVTLKKELDSIFENDMASLEESTRVQIYFYRFCQAICTGEEADCDMAKSFLTGKYLNESVWIENFCKGKNGNIDEEFGRHLPEVQSVILQHLFTEQQFSTLINFSNNIITNVDNTIQEQIQYYAGLSYFNIGDYLNASNILTELCNDTDQLYYSFFAAIAEIHKCNQYYFDGSEDTNIEWALQILKEMKHEKIYEKNLELVASTELIGYFNLGKKDTSFADEGINHYLGYGLFIRKKPEIKHLYALLCEEKHNFDNAIKIYLSLDWKNDLSVAQRLLACYSNKQEYEKVIELFEQLEVRDSKTQGLYLLAVKSKGDNYKFRNKLIESASQYGDSFSDFFYIAIIVGDKTDYDEVVEKQILLMLDLGKKFNNLEMHILTGYAYMFAHFGNIKLLSCVIREFDKLSILGDEILKEIYNGIYLILQKNDKIENNFNIPDEIEIAEKLIDRFLLEKIDEENFLWLKIICQKIRKKEYSILKYLKQLFKINHDANVAADILLLQLKHNKFDDGLYDYLQTVQQSTIAGHIMVAAIIYQHLGRYNEADFLSYKSLYILNGQDDFDIYQKYLSLHFNSLGHIEIPVTLERASEKCVIVLVPETGDEEKEWNLCLDGERDFNDDNNHSLGIDHINRNNRNFAKLSASVCLQVVSINGRKYKIKEIYTRTVYAFRFVLKKVDQYPEKFKGVLQSIHVSDNNIESLVEQMKSLIINQQEDSFLNFYISKSLRPRAPIDFLLKGDYKKYFDTILYLLYVPNGALYSGDTLVEKQLEGKYVITLSTLAILVLMGWTKLLDPIRDKIICPESYISFFQKLHAEEINLQKVSPGKIGKSVDQKLILIENDYRIPELWEEILELCEGFEKIPVTDEERISYKVIEGLTGEQLITGLKIDMIQLDSLIVASKAQAVYLCDDLFFRKIANMHNIKNLNFTSFLYYFVDIDDAVEVVKKLSATNYIYTPFIYRNVDEARIIVKNLMTGEIKRDLYRNFLKKYLGYTEFVKQI